MEEEMVIGILPIQVGSRSNWEENQVGKNRHSGKIFKNKTMREGEEYEVAGN